MTSVNIERVQSGVYTARNERGAEIPIGGDGFSPVELLLAAIGGCTAIDVDVVTSRRAEPDGFVVDVTAEKVRDDVGNHLKDITVTFRVAFPDGPDGDEAREILPDIARKSHDRLCTVSRTIELGTPVASKIAP